MLQNVLKESILSDYHQNKDNYLIKHINETLDVGLSQKPVHICDAYFWLTLYFHNQELVRMTMVASKQQHSQQYTDVPLRELHDKWLVSVFGKADEEKLSGKIYHMPQMQVASEFDPRSGSNIIHVVFNRSREENVPSGIKTGAEIAKYISSMAMQGMKVPHSTSQPVIYQENGIYYLAAFVFLFNREDIQQGMIDRPTLWVIADLTSGRIVDRRQTKEKDFSDAPYNIKYNVRADGEYDTSKKYYDEAYAILDMVRVNLIKTGNLDVAQYEKYLEKIIANIPKEYQRFYRDLSIKEQIQFR